MAVQDAANTTAINLRSASEETATNQLAAVTAEIAHRSTAALVALETALTTRVASEAAEITQIQAVV